MIQLKAIACCLIFLLGSLQEVVSARRRVSSGGVNITPDAFANSSVVFSGTTISWSHTVGAGSHSFLYVSLAGAATTGAASATCTYNSVSMTFLASKIDGGNGDAVAAFKLVNPTTGTNTVSCTWGATISTLIGQSSSWFGVNQVTPNRTPFTANNGGSAALSPTAVVVSNAVANDVVLDTTQVFVNPIAVGSGQTTRFLRNNVGGNNWGFGNSSEGASGSTTMSWTYSGTRFWAAIGVALIPG